MDGLTFCLRYQIIVEWGGKLGTTEHEEEGEKKKRRGNAILLMLSMTGYWQPKHKLCIHIYIYIAAFFFLSCKSIIYLFIEQKKCNFL